MSQITLNMSYVMVETQTSCHHITDLVGITALRLVVCVF